MSTGRISLDMLLPSDPSAAEILRQSIAAVVYAEMRAIFVGWAGAGAWDPVASVWGVTRRVLDEDLAPGTPAFLARVQNLLREESLLALEPALRVAMFHRASDQRIVSLAMSINRFLTSSIPIRS